MSDQIIITNPPGTPGAARWIGPWTIYGVQRQTLAVTSNPRAATGNFTFGANPSDGDPMPAINGFNGIVFKDSPSSFPEIQIEIDLATTLATLASQLESNKGGGGNEALADLTFSADATHLLITETAGAAGNATTLGTSTANITRSGATLTGGSDGGNFTVEYDGDESDPIQFDDNAAEVQAALEAIAALTGKVTVTGDMPESNIVIDDSLVPVLFVLGSNNLTDGEGAGAVDIFITDALRNRETYTPDVGDIVNDFFIQLVEPFASGASVILEDEPDNNGNWNAHPLVLDVPDNSGDKFTGTGPSFRSSFIAQSEFGVSQPLPSVCKISSVLYATLLSIGGTGATTGIVKVWLCVSTPVEP